MIRRSFRMGLLFGTAAGLAAAFAKVLEGRRDTATDSAPRPWTPLDTASAPATTPAPRHVPDQVMTPAPPAADVVEQAEAAPITEPLDAEAAPPAVPEAPVEKSVAPPVPAPPKKAPAKRAAAKKASKKSPKKAPANTRADTGPAWVEPEDSVCPASHPIKAKLSSMLFHLPGMVAYDRTRPDRCYRDAISAEADGLRAAKR